MCEQDFHSTYPKCAPKKKKKRLEGHMPSMLTTLRKVLAEGCCLLKSFLNFFVEEIYKCNWWGGEETTFTIGRGCPSFLSQLSESGST